MSASNFTPYLKLPQYAPTDKPTYLGDANSAYLAIDTGFHEVQGIAQSASDAVNSINLDTSNIMDTLSSVSATQKTQGSSIMTLTKDSQSQAADILAAQNAIKDLQATQGTMPVATFKQMLLNTAYPIGSIYISTSSTNPASLLGGTWISLSGRFLIGAGSLSTATGSVQFNAGSTGGNYQTYITEKQSPYKMAADENKDDWGLVRGSTADVGFGDRVVIGKSNEQHPTAPFDGQDPFTLMPPYLAVFMWKRTA